MADVKIAQAASSRFFSAWDDMAGNQRRTAGKLDGELNVEPIEKQTFTKCFRWKNPAIGAEAAAFAVRIVANADVGYSQNSIPPRTSLLTELRACHWVPEDIKNKCNCDCSSFVMTVCRKFDLDVSEAMYTEIERDELMKTGAFDEYDVTAGFKFALGDIVLRKGHTAIVCDVGDPLPEKTVINAASVCLRNAAGTLAAIPLAYIKGGERVELLGDSVTWYHCRYKGREGWVSGRYLD